MSGGIGHDAANAARRRRHVVRQPCPSLVRVDAWDGLEQAGSKILSANVLDGIDELVDPQIGRGDRSLTRQRFCRLAGMGRLSPGGIPQSGVPLGAIRVRTRAVSMLTSRQLSARPRSPRPVANRPHRRSNLGRFERGRSRGAITRLDVGMGYWGSMSDHFRTFLN